MNERVTLEQLIAILEDAKVDYNKLYVKGNKTAAGRLRKSLQDVTKLCKTARQEALEFKKTVEK
jgi:hypothetical protein